MGATSPEKKCWGQILGANIGGNSYFEKNYWGHILGGGHGKIFLKNLSLGCGFGGGIECGSRVYWVGEGWCLLWDETWQFGSLSIYQSTLLLKY